MAATVALVKLFGKTIPVPLEVDIGLDPFNVDDSGKDNPVLTVESPDGGKKKRPPKPETILPCPRCTSMATKFCYYNNYNLNQPRHFCKNCQRYWTAGGSMRNVPVGAGRRRNKHSAAHCRHVTILNAPNSPSGDGCFRMNPWGYPLSFHPMTGFLTVPCTSPSSSKEMAESEKRLWFPKTLRVGDPAEAAKSSIWATMELSKDVAGRGGLFHGFDQHKVLQADGSRVLHANPAAAARSFSFQKSDILAE